MNPKIDGVNIPGKGWCPRVPGTVVTKIKAIAGKGCAPFRDASFYVAKFGGSFDDWRKMRGEMVVSCGGVPIRIEVHWVQSAFVEEVDAKYIRRLK